MKVYLSFFILCFATFASSCRNDVSKTDKRSVPTEQGNPDESLAIVGAEAPHVAVAPTGSSVDTANPWISSVDPANPWMPKIYKPETIPADAPSNEWDVPPIVIAEAPKISCEGRIDRTQSVAGRGSCIYFVEGVTQADCEAIALSEAINAADDKVKFQGVTDYNLFCQRDCNAYAKAHCPAKRPRAFGHERSFDIHPFEHGFTGVSVSVLLTIGCTCEF